MIIRLPKLKNALQVGIFLMIIKVSASQSAILAYNDLIDDVLSLLAVFFLGISILNRKYTYKILFLYAVVSLVSLYSTMKTGNYGFLITIITCLAIRDEEIDQIVNFIYRYELIFLILHTLYSLVAFLVFDDSLIIIGRGETRFQFGFVHPNVFSIYLFNLMLMWVWINFEAIEKKHIVILSGVGVVSYLFTRTRTSLINLVILVFLLLLCKYKKSSKKLLQICAKGIVPIIAVVVIALVVNYTTGNIFSLAADEILTYRIKLGAYAYENYGITLMGKDVSSYKVVWDSYWRISAHTFDCVYTYLAMNQGAFWLAVISFLFYRLACMGNLKINIAIIMWALYGINEIHGLNGYQFFPILLTALLFSNDYRKEPPGICEVKSEDIR